MKILLIAYSIGVVVSFVCGVVLLWYTADKGTHSYDYKIAQVMINYALVFPYGCIKIIDLLEQERDDHDL